MGYRFNKTMRTIPTTATPPMIKGVDNDDATLLTPLLIALTSAVDASMPLLIIRSGDFDKSRKSL